MSSVMSLTHQGHIGISDIEDTFPKLEERNPHTKVETVRNQLMIKATAAWFQDITHGDQRELKATDNGSPMDISDAVRIWNIVVVRAIII